MNYIFATNSNMLLPEFGDNGDVVKNKWTISEDHNLNELVKYYGTNEWVIIATHMPNRNSRQCRERWKIRLNPDILKGEWKPEEDKVIFAIYSEKGNRWAAMAKALPGRTESDIRNRCFALERSSSREKQSQLAMKNILNAKDSLESLDFSRQISKHIDEINQDSKNVAIHNKLDAENQFESTSSAASFIRSFPVSSIVIPPKRRVNIRSKTNLQKLQKFSSQMNGLVKPNVSFDAGMLAQHQMLNPALSSQLIGDIAANHMYRNNAYGVDFQNLSSVAQYQQQLQHQQQPHLGHSGYGCMYPQMPLMLAINDPRFVASVHQQILNNAIPTPTSAALIAAAYAQSSILPIQHQQQALVIGNNVVAIDDGSANPYIFNQSIKKLRKE